MSPKVADMAKLTSKTFVAQNGQAGPLVDPWTHTQAERGLRDALATDPDDALTWFRLGGLLVEQGRLSEALVSYDQLLTLRPGQHEAMHNRAVVLNALGRPAEALEMLNRVIAQVPNFARAHYNSGVAYAALKRYADAVAAYDRLLALDPEHAMGWNNRGVALQALGQTGLALASFGRASTADPQCAATWANQGNLLRQLNRMAEALHSCNSALKADPNYVSALNERGVVLGRLGRHADALADFDRSIAIDPRFVEAHENRFVLLTELGRTQEATSAIEEAIRLAPRRVRPYYNFTETRKVKEGDSCIGAMEALAEDLDSLSESDRIELCFSLGKAYADTGRHDQAFGWFSRGCALKRSRIAYNEPSTLGIFERAAKIFDDELIRAMAGSGNPSDVPVFILGMPRSGTTLIEQMLASHPKVFAVGEIEAFLAAMVDAAAHEQVPDTPEGFAALSAEALHRLGGSYLNRVRPRAPHAMRIIDKSLQSFRFAGLIHLALPNARFLRLRRNPLDTCLSCFSKLFAHDLRFTYELGELGRYHAAFDRLMDHWTQVLPSRTLMEVCYEEMVADPEAQARRILDHCGLEWDPAVLDFHRTRRTIRTASVNQVRQPIYSTSVGRWKPYDQHLGPLKQALGLD